MTARPTCLIVQPIHAAGHAALRRAGLQPLDARSTALDDLLPGLAQAVAVITRNSGLSSEAIGGAPHLRVVGVHGVGTDAVAVDVATGRGIAVVNTPGSNVGSVAEHAIGLVFALMKGTVAGDAAVRTGDASFKFRVRLTELSSRTIGIIGFGAIGRATATLARALGMRVLVWSPRGLAADAVFEEVADLSALLSVSDIVSLHLPLAPSTRGLLDAAAFAAMRPGAILINTARGGLVDETALVEALRSGRIGGAGLDVFAAEPLAPDHPLCRLGNVVLSPHVGGSSEEALERTAIAVVGGIVDALCGRRPANLVNPTVWPLTLDPLLLPGETPP